jgi:hypothetical protein
VAANTYCDLDWGVGYRFRSTSNDNHSVVEHCTGLTESVLFWREIRTSRPKGIMKDAENVCFAISLLRFM